MNGEDLVALLLRQLQEAKAEGERRLQEVKAEAKAEAEKREAQRVAEVKAVKADADKRVQEVKADADKRVQEVKADADKRVQEVKEEADKRVQEAEKRVAEIKEYAEQRVIEADKRVIEADKRADAAHDRLADVAKYVMRKATDLVTNNTQPRLQPAIKVLEKNSMITYGVQARLIVHRDEGNEPYRGKVDFDKRVQEVKADADKRVQEVKEEADKRVQEAEEESRLKQSRSTSNNDNTMLTDFMKQVREDADKRVQEVKEEADKRVQEAEKRVAEIKEYAEQRVIEADKRVIEADKRADAAHDRLADVAKYVMRKATDLVTNNTQPRLQPAIKVLEKNSMITYGVQARLIVHRDEGNEPYRGKVDFVEDNARDVKAVLDAPIEEFLRGNRKATRLSTYKQGINTKAIVDQCMTNIQAGYKEKKELNEVVTLYFSSDVTVCYLEPLESVSTTAFANAINVVSDIVRQTMNHQESQLPSEMVETLEAVETDIHSNQTDLGYYFQKLQV